MLNESVVKVIAKGLLFRFLMVNQAAEEFLFPAELVPRLNGFRSQDGNTVFRGLQLAEEVGDEHGVDGEKRQLHRIPWVLKTKELPSGLHENNSNGDAAESCCEEGGA
jgi:hypothetical protein